MRILRLCLDFKDFSIYMSHCVNCMIKNVVLFAFSLNTHIRLFIYPKWLYREKGKLHHTFCLCYLKSSKNLKISHFLKRLQKGSFLPSSHIKVSGRPVSAVRSQLIDVILWDPNSQSRTSQMLEMDLWATAGSPALWSKSKVWKDAWIPLIL